MSSVPRALGSHGSPSDLSGHVTYCRNESGAAGQRQTRAEPPACVATRSARGPLSPRTQVLVSCGLARPRPSAPLTGGSPSVHEGRHPRDSAIDPASGPVLPGRVTPDMTARALGPAGSRGESPGLLAKQQAPGRQRSGGALRRGAWGGAGWGREE